MTFNYSRFSLFAGFLETKPWEKWGMTLCVAGHRLWSWWVKYSIQPPGTVSLSGVNTLLSSLSHQQLILRPYSKLQDRQSLCSFSCTSQRGLTEVTHHPLWMFEYEKCRTDTEYYHYVFLEWGSHIGRCLRYDVDTSSSRQDSILYFKWERSRWADTIWRRRNMLRRLSLSRKQIVTDTWFASQKAEQSGGLPCRVRYINTSN